MGKVNFVRIYRGFNGKYNTKGKGFPTKLVYEPTMQYIFVKKTEKLYMKKGRYCKLVDGKIVPY